MIETAMVCYVDELIEAMVRMAKTELDVTGPVTELRLAGSRSKLVYRPLPSDDPRQRQPDITLARSLLDWEPKVGLEDRLKETVRFFKTVV